MTRSLGATLCVALLVAFFWRQGERVIATNGPTFDEGAHLTAGYGYLTAGDFAMNPEHPPLLKMWWALPLALGDAPPYPKQLSMESKGDHWQVATEFLYRSGVPHQSLFAPARRMNLAIGCGIVLLAGWWSFRLWGSRLAGIAAAGFAAFDPNLLALSCVLSTDAGFALFALLTCYLLWEYAAAPSRGLLLATGASLGLMLGTKLSAIAMVGGLGAAGVLFVWRGGVLALPGHIGGYRAAFDLAFRLGVIAIIVLAATYGFVHFEEWGRGLKFQLTRAEHGDGRMYLDGELSKTGWRHYFLVVLWLKLPLGLIVASGFSLILIAFGKRDSSRRLVLFLVPPLAFFVAASLARVDMGIRVVLPATVFLYVLAAAAARKPASGLLVLGCLAWSFIAAHSAFPVAYFNELAGERPWNRVADSNLDWGQGLPALAEYMHQEKLDSVYLSYFGTDRPEASGIRFQALPGYGRVGPASGESIPETAPRHVLAISANNLLGIYLNDSELFAFLRSRQPDRILAGSIFIFDLTYDPEALHRVRAAFVR